MQNENLNNKIVNRLIKLEDKFVEIKSIAKILNIWIKEKDYELIPVINMLDDKINEVEKIFNTNF